MLFPSRRLLRLGPHLPACKMQTFLPTSSSLLDTLDAWQHQHERLARTRGDVILTESSEDCSKSSEKRARKVVSMAARSSVSDPISFLNASTAAQGANGLEPMGKSARSSATSNQQTGQITSTVGHRSQSTNSDEIVPRLVTLFEARKESSAGAPSYPDFEDWSVSQMQVEARAWGFRSSTDKSDLASKLQYVWSFLCSNFRETRSLAALRMQANDGVAVQLPYPSDNNREQSASPQSEQPWLHAALARAVRTDLQLYRRILLMEPIAFEEIMSLAQQHALFDETKSPRQSTFSAPVGIEAASLGIGRSDRKKLAGSKSRGKQQEEIKRWLDLSGIVWYSATDVRSSRH